MAHVIFTSGQARCLCMGSLGPCRAQEGQEATGLVSAMVAAPYRGSCRWVYVHMYIYIYVYAPNIKDLGHLGCNAVYHVCLRSAVLQLHL